jgi:hypothetical protein
MELLHFLSVAAALRQSCLASGRFAEMNVAVPAHYNGLRVRKHGCNLKAPRTFDIHEE